MDPYLDPLIKIATRLAEENLPSRFVRVGMDANTVEVTIVHSSDEMSPAIAQTWMINTPSGKIHTSTLSEYNEPPEDVEHGETSLQIGDQTLSLEQVLGLVIASSDPVTDDGTTGILDQEWVNRMKEAGFL